jgi:hypothetical protein
MRITRERQRKPRASVNSVAEVKSPAVGERRRDVLHGPYVTKSGLAPSDVSDDRIDRVPAREQPSSVTPSISNVADMTNKDAFDLWWEWAEKPLDSMLTIDAAIHEAVTALPLDKRHDRAKVNEAVRDGLTRGPLRPAGSADSYGVPKATE